MADPLADSIAALQKTIDASVPPSLRPPTLQDSVSTLLNTVGDKENEIKADIFNARQKRMAQPISAPPGGTATAAAMGVVGGMVKGVTAPVAAFLPDAFNDKIDAWQEDSVRKMLGLQARSQYKGTYAVMPTFSRFIAGEPGMAGEFAGSVLPFIPAYGAARELFAVPQAVEFGEKAVRTVMAAGATGGLLSAAAQLDPGESRFAKIAKDSLAMGAFEMVGIPAMRKAWAEESPTLLKAIQDLDLPSLKAEAEPAKAAAVPTPPLGKADQEKLAAQVTAVRAGVPASDEVVDKILQAAKGKPELENTPVVIQAAKQKEAKQRLVNPQTIVDPLLASENTTLKARVQISIDGQPAPPQDIHFDPKNPGGVKDQVQQLLKGVRALASTGQDVRLESITGGTQEDVQDILTALKGKQKPLPNPDVKKRGVPGAAPKNTSAANGKVPAVGDRVQVVEPGKPVAVGQVVEPAASPTSVPPEPTTPIQRKLTPEQKADRYARSVETSGTVPVQMADNTVKQVPLAQLQVPLEVGNVVSERLAPHLDGQVRHGIIHVDEGNISYEGVGSSQDPNQNYFRSEMFSNVAPDQQWGNDPRLFIHKDGVTISVPTYPETKQVTRRGFLRTAIAAGREAVERTTGGVTEEILAQRYNLKPGERFKPWDPEMEKEQAAYEQIAQAIPKELRQHPVTQEYFDTSEGFIFEHMDAGISRQGVLQDLKIFAENMTNPDTKFIKRVGQLLNSVEVGGPELATAKRAAQTLLKNGVAGDTPVAVKLALLEHGEKGIDKGTLKELAETQLPLANLQQLQDSAAERGLTATPFGDKVNIGSKRGYNRIFANSLEAHEAVLRIPTGQVDKKIEAALEKEWKIGSERSWDPDVDVNRFIPLEQQEAGITDVAKGNRALTPVYTREPKALQDTIEKLNDGLGLPKGTLKVKLLPAMDAGPRKAAVVYNEGKVAMQAAKYRDALNAINITQREPGELLEALSRKGKGNGIYVVSGRDGESAALYAKYRDEGNKEFWEKGRVEYDSLGPYRRYSKDAKAGLYYRGAGDEKYLPVDASDILSPPAGVHFAADSGDKPRVMEEMAPYEPDWGSKPPDYTKKTPPPGEFRDTSGPFQKIVGNRFRPMMELSKDLTVRTGVPFYNWYRAVEEGRHKVSEVANPLLESFKNLAKPLSREDRKWAQLLFEGRIAGADVSKLESQLSDKVKVTATKIRELYTNFFKGEGFTDKDVEDFFSLFPHVRKADGDFRYISTGRSQIPRIGQLLSKDLENGSIMIDSRELDFQRIANRIVRGTATERYLLPSWNRVVTEIEAYKQARRIPSDYEGIFNSYLGEVLHMPDDLQKSSARAVRQVFSKLGGRISEIESQDAVSMLTQMNAFTNMAWSPGQVLRNFFQTLQTSLPIVGTKDTLEGWRYAMKWWKDVELQKKMVNLRVLQPNAIYEPLQELTRLIEGGGGKVDKALDVFFNQGTRWHTNAFDFNKVVAYRAQYVRAKRVGQEYLSKKIDWPTFLEKSRLDMRDAKGGPFLAEIKNMLDAGKLEDASNRAGEEFAKSTQFVYTRGNAPYVMQSTLGRFLLQFGTWPAWYTENLRNMVARGSVKNRVGATARWLGVQSAMFGTANALFGVDLARWTFFSPLGYQGGPFAQMGLQGIQTWHSITDPTSNDPVDRIAKARLASSIVRQLTPLPVGTALNVGKAGGFMLQGAWPDAARQLFGLPAAKGSLIGP